MKQAVLSQTAVLKLNGGLGTSMGLEKAKSLLEIKNGKAFLDLIAEQIKHTRETFDSNVKFTLMNSFSTSEDTKVRAFFPCAANCQTSIMRSVLSPAGGDDAPSSVFQVFLGKNHGDLLKEPFIELMQNMSPKIDAETLEPAVYPQNPGMEW